ncbi:exosome non-catalytic core subunit RRP42 KNAG_0I00680 [Huiozyma naganishii CBS 8797]|uniref:Ribosomal RNA-processing protein 42 n=1 Tax=Huiozyma naganishii (strain ATCC MYA-139 / BCRC 22969 / CBS 8797 / KCTC 17520 / NBRC 10181 / NCYC 3082 / Yp74L-3) TaxID=1071383 RepID=J7S915_HUIN7|nr:hypothetical protein KNAG_0I00680 [Kazachstania naganishii CBS 8797]CCK71859.1 hypothetical protein KNAG_0I00680 [Kazachstania naganishii CBS 8797]
MSLSIAEESFLYDSLSGPQRLRPDGRLPHQFRPVEVFTDFLPSSDGSSRVIASDGSECIVSVKCKVVDHTVEPDLIQVDVDIAGERDDSLLVESIASLLNKLIGTVDHARLQLTKKYSFKIFIDVLVLSSFSYPISLISFGVYFAVSATQLPKLVSNFDDLEVEELPMFDDYDLVPLEMRTPLVFTLALVGKNVFLDPAANESAVANNGLVVSWSAGTVVAPLRTIALNNTHVTGFDPELLQVGIKLVEQHAPGIVHALEG